MIDRILDLLCAELAHLCAQEPGRLCDARTRLAGIESRIDAPLGAVEAGQGDSVATRLREREAERDRLRQVFRRLEAASRVRPVEPTREWVESSLTSDFAELLRGDERAVALALRQMIGRIEIRPERKPWLRKPHAVARFSLDLGAGLPASNGEPRALGFGREIELEIRKLLIYERYASDVRRLRDEDGLSFPQIACRLGLSHPPEVIKSACCQTSGAAPPEFYIVGAGKEIGSDQ